MLASLPNHLPHSHPTTLSFIFLILLARSLDNLSLSYLEAFAPLYTLLAFLLLSTLFTCWVFAFRHDESGLWYASADRYHGLVSYLIFRLYRDSGLARALVGMTCASISVWIVFLSLKLAQIVTWSYSLVFIPLWIAAGLLYMWPFGLATDKQSMKPVLIGLVVGTITPLWVFTVLVCLRLDHVTELAMEHVFIPLWLLDAIGLIAMFVGIVTGLVRKKLDLCVISVLGYVMIALPWVVFKLLIVMRSYGLLSTSYVVLFAPLFVWMGVVWCTSTCLSWACYNH